MSGVTGFTDLMLAQGKQPSSKTISYHVMSPSLSEIEKLKLKDDAQVLRMERVRYGDDVPISFEVATIPLEIVEGLSKQEVSESLYRTLETKKGVMPGHAKQMVSASTASERIAEYLDIKRGDAFCVYGKFRTYRMAGHLNTSARSTLANGLNLSSKNNKEPRS